MNLSLLLLALLALVVVLTWLKERQPKKLGPSFRPWHVRLLPRGKKK